ncbi:Cytochrome P450 71A25 [Bienertia sinuspersici]
MFSAGTDTTSTLLEWTMTELLRHPRIMKELQKEVREITRDLDVKEDELEQMKYLKAVIKETLRLHLPVPLLIPRQSTQDTKIHGYNIPAKTGVIVNGWAIHRDPANWDEPEKFNPERFLNSPTDFRGNDLQFIPFGAGRRMCPGISFAMASSQLILANFMHKFDWALPGGEEGETLDMSESFGINMHRNTPLLAVATSIQLPIIGNLHQLGTHPYRSLQSLSQQHGELMLIHIGRSPALIVSSAKAAQQIMKTHDIVFSNRPTSKTNNKLLYNSKDVAAAPYGEYWRQMKSICVLQLLSNKRVRSFRGVREEEMTHLMGKIEGKASSVVNLSEMFMTFTNNVICRVAFGRTYSGNEGGFNFQKLLKEFLELLGSFRVGDFIPWLAWINWVDGSDAKVERVVKEFDQFLEQVVKQHQDGRGDSRKDGDSENDEVVKDIVDVLLDVQKEKATGFAMDRDSIKALILDIFSGGTDTTYTVLEWAMTELLRHPKVMEELKKEVRGITREKIYVSEDDLEQMKYLKAVIKETLRLHPPIPLLVPRRSTQETKINGYDIPEGITVINNAWAIHRDPASWVEPEKFDPVRFLNSPTDFRGQNFELIPFGAGRRICPGIMFAIANNELVLANLVHKFDWMLPGGAGGETLDMSECTGLTAHRKIPLLAIAAPVIASN